MSERAHPSSSDTARFAVTALQATTPHTPGSAEGTPPPSPIAPLRVGRFTVLRELGVGGMGVVYAAYDERLDRKVAVKLVRAELSDVRPEATRRAMLREAQAMAKVEHPNVITVYEVGELDDQVFVAMELVTGGDLRTWMTSARRTWRDVLRICLQAGEGLAAAHRAGLVHRDFKPDNVLVGSDGRVRVTDFGLARPVFASGDAQAPAPAVPAEAPVDRLTRTGALIGTPAYMAPEQHMADPADARSDQFAFCVTVWEALFGERPFAGGTYAVLATNVLDGAVREPPKGNKVPARVRAALRRGLMTSPADRFPSMDALLAALSNQRGRTIALAVGASVLVAAAVTTTWAVTRQPAVADATCSDPQAKLAGVWDPARRDALAHGLAAAGPFADVGKRAAAGLDAYVDKWSQSWLDACRARGDQSPALFDLRVTCLGKRLKEVDALVGALASTHDPSLASRAGALVEGLVPVAQCNDAMSLLRVQPPPAAMRATIENIDAQLDKVMPLKLGNRYAEARTLLEHAVEDTQRAGYKPREAMALFLLGLLQNETGDNTEAEKNLVKASSLALAAQDDYLAAQALVELVAVVGYNLGKPAEAHRWADLAKASLERIGDPPQIRLKLLGNLGRVLVLEGKHDDALATLDQGIALAEKRDDSLNELGGMLSAKEVTLFDLGRFDEAKRLVDRELDLAGRIEGVQHPGYADVLESRANLYFVANQWDLGIADLKQARAIKLASLGPDTTTVMGVENNLGVVADELGDFAEALRASRVATALQEKAASPDHPDAAKGHANMGSALTRLGKLAEAEQELAHALAVHERSIGTKHVDYGVDLQHVGELRLAQKRPREAAESYTRARDIFVAALGAEHPQVAYATSGLGRAQLALGEARSARITLAQTMQSLEASHVDPQLMALTRIALADALWKLGEHKAAVAEAAKAEPDLAPLPPGSNPTLRTQIAAWRAAHH